MSEAIIVTTIIMAGLLLIAIVWCGSVEGMREQSLWRALLETWREHIAAKAEVEKAKAMHEKACPRTTDTPRKP